MFVILANLVIALPRRHPVLFAKRNFLTFYRNPIFQERGSARLRS